MSYYNFNLKPFYEDDMLPFCLRSFGIPVLTKQYLPAVVTGGEPSCLPGRPQPGHTARRRAHGQKWRVSICQAYASLDRNFTRYS